MDNRTNKPVSWIGSATGDKFPIQMDMDHPLWQTFLESGSKSPSQFFRLFFSPPTYFHNPTPWRSRSSSRLAQKVTELLDSFRPGSFSYQPFKKQSTASSRTRTTGTTNNMIVVEAADTNNNNHDNAFPGSHTNHNQDIRNRLYLDPGRPRPFYRRTSLTRRPSQNPNPASTVNVDIANPTGPALRHLLSADPKSLQEIVRNSLLKIHGLRRLGRILDHQAQSVPQSLRDKLLTFDCTDFKEINHENNPTATYQVECLHENAKIAYRASFFTSEVDKAVRNVWMENRSFLDLDLEQSCGINPVLALAADQLTENVFIITEDLLKSTQVEIESPEINKLLTKLLNALKTNPELPIPMELGQYILIGNNNEHFLQNPLLIKSRNMCSTLEEKENAIKRLNSHQH